MSHHEHGESLALPLIKSPLLHQETVHNNYSESDPGHSHDEERPNVVSDVSLHNHPQFHRHSEATNAELFYDLFFVANLTIFTNVHEVNDKRTLAQYAGFFSILWFTWYQVGLYDVRFSMDSLLERVIKICQFGVMLGFAIVGPNFDVGVDNSTGDSDDPGPSTTSYQALTLILMASRFILVLQYLQSMYFTRRFKETRLPLALIAATYAIAGFIYLGLFWTFNDAKQGVNYSFVTWYVVAILETMIATSVSSIWRVISFKGTHLVQRMSLLTLIIFGEGVIGLCRQCQNIVMSSIFTFSSSIVGYFVCGLFIIYFLYQIYFDWVAEKFGTIRQQIWAFIHFPLHLMLALSLEGMSQSIAWRAGSVAYNDILAEENTVVNQLDASSAGAAAWAQAAAAANQTATNYLGAALAASKTATETFEYLAGFDIIARGYNVSLGGAENPDEATNGLGLLYYYSVTTAYEAAGFSPPANASEDPFDLPTNFDDLFEAVQEKANGVAAVYELAFIYFFVATGLVVLLCTLLAALSHQKKRPVHWIRLGVSGFVGFSLCLISLLAVSDYTDSDAYSNFVLSAWVLPTVTLALAVVVVVNSVRLSSGPGLRLVPMRTKEGRPVQDCC